MTKQQRELTFEEFCQSPMQYTLGTTGDWGAHRMYRNEMLGIQREVITEREEPGNLYGGWKGSEFAYFMDGDNRQFATRADLYVAWMARVCGVEEQA